MATTGADDERERADYASPPSVRLDRWLWAARVFHSRSLAAQACSGGKVGVNGGSAKAHKAVRIGDLIEVTLANGKRRLRILQTAERRGPAPVARQLYEDLTPPPPPKIDLPAAPRRAGRPTKRERRQLDRFRGW